MYIVPYEVNQSFAAIVHLSIIIRCVAHGIVRGNGWYKNEKQNINPYLYHFADTFRLTFCLLSLYRLFYCFLCLFR